MSQPTTPSSAHDRPFLTVACVIERDHRFLLVEEWVRGKKRINQPGGHVELGESLQAAAIRETLEETGLKVEISGLVGIYQWRGHITTKEYCRITFAANVIERVNPGACDDNIIGHDWYSVDALKRINNWRGPAVRQAINDYRNGAMHPIHPLQDLR